MNGILLVDKPSGWTSFDVVNYTRKIVARASMRKPRSVKVGHSGTLDPLATGLLVLCVGKTTKSISEMIKKDKVYEVFVKLGSVSSTGDSEGVIIAVSKIEPPLDQIKAEITNFIGEIDQVPPNYSAVKVNGKRAYDLARAGENFTLNSRKVTIYSIDDIKYEYPELYFRAHVGSGTYIRSLAEDIGKNLGCGAYLTGLRRTKIGDHSVGDALKIEDINEEKLKELLTK